MTAACHYCGSRWANLTRLVQHTHRVPPWECINARACERRRTRRVIAAVREVWRARMYANDISHTHETDWGPFNEAERAVEACDQVSKALR